MTATADDLLAPPPLADLCVAIQASLGQVAAQMERMNQLQARLQATPTTVDMAASGVVPPTGPLVLNLQGPEVGRKWLVRALRVTDAGNVTTAVVGAAAFYGGQPIPPQAGLASWVPSPPTQLIWPFLTLPNAITLSGGAVQVTSTNNLICVVTGGTVGQGILAMATIEDIDLTALAVVETA